MRYVDIFVGHIHSAGKCDLAVYDDYFSVVAVIVNNRYHGYEFIELPRVYTLFAEFAIKPGSDFGNAAHVVVHEIYLYAVFHFIEQNFMHGVPHNAFLNDKIFYKDILFGGRKGLFEFFEVPFARRQIFYIVIVVHG
ncbi:unknown [Acidiphilium sp. CAG:727]|nr:unknown [Acidiphilium sp. CAG:727]